MADFFRPRTSTSRSSSIILCCLLFVLACFHNASAYPLPSHPGALHGKRVAPIVVTSPQGNNTAVVNPETRQEIPQGSATDGGGTGLSPPAIIWLVFVFVVGAPLGFAGIRLWRVTTGMAMGLAAALGVWAAFVNTISSDSMPDLVLTVIVFAGFAIGFALGMLKIGRLIGIIVLGVIGGFSIGVRVVLLRPGLLVPVYLINWFILAITIIVGLVVVLWKQRFGIVSSSAAVGTFLMALGIDLLLEKQAGMSFGLRFLLDRNNSHFLAIVHRGYNPTIMNQVILGASIAAIPILAFGQHKIFKGPFKPKSTDADTLSLADSDPGLGMQEPKSQPPRTSRMAFLKSRFSLT